MHSWPEHFQPDVVKAGFGGKLSSYTIALEAWRRGLGVTFLDPELKKYRVKDDSGRSVSFIRSRPHMSTVAAVRTANDKFKTHQILEQAGIASPQAQLLPHHADIERVLTTAEMLGYPVVLKPLEGSMGRGVFAGIASAPELQRQYKRLEKFTNGGPVLMEKHMDGEDFRVLVYGDEMVAACKRVPANVVGDGQRTVADLIKAKNSERRKNPFLSKGLIRVDDEVRDHLEVRGYTLTSVPPADEYLRLREAANASAGGDVVEFTSDLPREITRAAVAAVGAIPNLFCAGVDILYDEDNADINTNYTIIELNSHPQIGVNMYPTEGVGVDVPRRILDITFPDSARSSESSDVMTSIRLGSLLTPLKTGAAAEVQLSPIPGHRFAHTIAYERPAMPSPSTRVQNQLFRAALAHEVTGTLRTSSDESSELCIAGSHKGTQGFATAAEQILGSPLGTEKPYQEPIYNDFQIQ